MLFFLAGQGGGLFDLDFSVAGQAFVLQLMGPDAGFIDGPVITLNTGVFDITPGTPDGTLSILGELNPPVFNFDAVGSGTVSAVATAEVPEPSSLLLLGSGFLALGSFARKRLLAR